MIKDLVQSIRREMSDRSDKEMMLQSEHRLLLVTKSRWFIIALLFFYGTASAFSYYGNYSPDKILELIFWPASILCIVTLINCFYHFCWYRYPWMWVDRIKLFIRTQVILDALFVTLMVHFTGGVASWFWTLYIVLTIELTYLIPVKMEIIAIGLVSVLLYSTLVFLEYLNIISPVTMPFMIKGLQFNLTYVLIVWFWVFFLNTVAAFVTMYMHKLENVQIRERVIRDGLTNLYNRRFFNHSINSEVERAKRFDRTLSLLMLDLDDFKKYNDTFGHLAGDNLLRIVSSIVGDNVRRQAEEPTYDIDIACRYGGEEFAIILPETGQASVLKKAEKLKEEVQTSGAVILAEKLRTQVEKTKMAGKGITVSIGVATYPSHAKDTQDLIEAADKALYQAKALGKNRISVAVAPKIKTVSKN